MAATHRCPACGREFPDDSICNGRKGGRHAPRRAERVT